jgi:hypothetical protein
VFLQVVTLEIVQAPARLAGSFKITHRAWWWQFLNKDLYVAVEIPSQPTISCSCENFRQQPILSPDLEQLRC